MAAFLSLHEVLCVKALGYQQALPSPGAGGAGEGGRHGDLYSSGIMGPDAARSPAPGSFLR